MFLCSLPESLVPGYGNSCSNFVFISLMIQYTVNLNNICVLIVSLFLGEFVAGQHIF